jgi:hypothetical protein
MHQEVPLKEAQALTKLAEYEPDPITQEMKYLDGILCFVLSGHLMENDGTRERGILKIYNDTIDLIKLVLLNVYLYFLHIIFPVSFTCIFSAELFGLRFIITEQTVIMKSLMSYSKWLTIQKETTGF